MCEALEEKRMGGCFYPHRPSLRQNDDLHSRSLPCPLNGGLALAGVQFRFYIRKSIGSPVSYDTLGT